MGGYLVLVTSRRSGYLRGVQDRAAALAAVEYGPAPDLTSAIEWNGRMTGPASSTEERHHDVRGARAPQAIVAGSQLTIDARGTLLPLPVGGRELVFQRGAPLL